MLTPTERAAYIEQYGRGWSELVTALAGFPREMWQHKPAPHSWSIHEQLIHLPDSEANSFGRFRAAIAQPGVRIFAYDQDQWARALDYHSQDPDDALELLRLLRKMTYDLIKHLPEGVWAQTIDHPENGIMSLDDVLVVYAEHVPGHIQQMGACYADWLAQQGKAG